MNVFFINKIYLGIRIQRCNLEIVTQEVTLKTNMVEPA